MFMGHRDASSFVISGSAAMNKVPSSGEEMMIVGGACLPHRRLFTSWFACLFW